MLLKDCPFCGHTPDFSHHSEHYHNYETKINQVYRWQVSIHCRICSFHFGSAFGEVKWEGGNALAHQYATKRIAERWNRRTELTKESL